ncbi:MAG TPA: isochorismatase family cysteine hydrolase [Candidatus Bilamarchaeaceae archaeon]|nr:isochorismatase family cysteine hydrolase [Candidatus Bilamarchaeaceae archaeon]
MKTALIVIDVQNYFMNEHTYFLPKKIAAHMDQTSYDVVAFTRFVNSSSSPFQKVFGWDKCIGSPDIDIVPELQPYAKNVFEKNGFSVFRSSKLLSFLHQNAIQEVHLCGTDTEACVLSSAFDAFEAGFHVRILYDLCASTHGPAFHRAARSILERNLEKPPG